MTLTRPTEGAVYSTPNAYPVRFEASADDASENRVEATLVEGALRRHVAVRPRRAAGHRPQTLRVVAGDVVQMAADSVTFRLQGRPGERVVFVDGLPFTRRL